MSNPYREPPKMRFKPLGDRVIVKRTAAKDKTEGGIIIPDIAKEKMIEGEIVQIGTGKIQEDGSIRPLDVKVGDHILFGKYSGTEVKVDGEEVLILREEDIFGILEPLEPQTAPAVSSQDAAQPS